MPRLLLIDDNEDFRPLIRLQLERAGYEVREAKEGDKGLRLHREQPADLVICDLFMPGKDGIETIRELRQTSSVPIIAIAGDGPVAGDPLLAIVRALGANKTLLKPFSIETLLKSIQEMLPDKS